MGMLVFLALLAAPVLIAVPLWIATGGGRGNAQARRARTETADGSSREARARSGAQGSSPSAGTAAPARSSLEVLRAMAREQRR